MERLVIVSADSHAAADPEDYRSYIDPQYKDRIDELVQEGQMFGMAGQMMAPKPEVLELIDDDGAITSGGVEGGANMTRRLREMDREGIAAEIVLAGTQTTTLPFFATINRPHPPELRAAGARAYHRWLADAIEVGKGRFFPIAEVGPCVDMAETLKELNWVAEHGFVGVQVPGYTGDPTMPPLFDPYFEPYFDACADLGLVMIMHAGFGLEQGSYYAMFDRIAAMPADLSVDERMAAIVKDPFFSTLEIRFRRAMWQVLLSGAFDRHPELKLVFTELGADWVPVVLSVMDEEVSRGELLSATEPVPMKMRPSEYWQRNCGVVASSIKRAEVEMRHEIGMDQLMFGTDYPHPESTWPNTTDWMRAAFVGVPEDEVRKILSENAIRFYGLDADSLSAIADRVGPAVSDIVLEQNPVDQRRIDLFTARAAFGNPARTINTEELSSVFTEETRHCLTGVSA